MFKISNFFHIFVLMMIANSAIVQSESCAEDLLDDIDEKHCGELGKLEGFWGSGNARRSSLPLQTPGTGDDDHFCNQIADDGEYIEPRTPNEGALISHAKALEDCVRSLPVKAAVLTDKSYFSCIDKADDELNEAYDCSS